jgi:predicted ATP-grasp superfamily ATP-dependent carboligase
LAEYKKNFVCLNGRDLLKSLENKISFKKKFASRFDFLDARVVHAKELSAELVRSLFSKLGKKLVFQKEIANGGSGTFLIGEDNIGYILEKRDDDSYFTVTKYLEKSIPVNIHLIIFEKEILVFPASVQINEPENHCLLYKGGDYIAFGELSGKIKSQVYETAKEFGGMLQKEGFRGICGVDALINRDNIFLLEVNPRLRCEYKRKPGHG